MLQQQLLTTVVQTLATANIEYVLTGSIVSSLLGEPRSTHDIDILVVALQEESIKKLVETFQQPNYYLDEESIIDALKHKSMFNLIDIQSGYKVDFWILTDDAFDVSRFSRRMQKKIYDTNVFITTSEDTIIAKLRWAKLSGGSAQQLKDATRIFEVQYRKLDIQYLELWITTLELHNEWNHLLKSAKPIT